MKKRFTILIIPIFLGISISLHALPQNNVKENARFKVKVIVTGADDNLPLKDTRIILASNESFRDIDIQYTDGTGTAVMNAIYGGKYEITLYHAYYKRAKKEITINKYGNETEFTETFVLDRIYKKSELTKKDKAVDIFVKGKDHEGNIKPLKRAMISGPGEIVYTDNSGAARFNHAYPISSMIYFLIQAEGYVPKEEGVLIGTKPAMIYEPDKLEVVLEIEPLTTVQLQILVLDQKTEKPVDSASVSIEFKTPIKVNGQLKSIFSSEVSNRLGQADFTDSNERSIPAELVNSNEFKAVVAKKGYETAWSDIPKEFLVPALSPKIYTVWLKPEEKQFSGPGWKLVSVTIDPDKASGEAVMGTKSLNISKNTVTVSIRTCNLELTYSDIPEFISDAEPAKMDVQMTFTGDDNNIYMNISFNVSVFEVDASDYDFTVGKIGSSFEKRSKKATYTIKSGFASVDEARIFPQVFFSTTNKGPVMFEAKYIRVK